MRAVHKPDDREIVKLNKTKQIAHLKFFMNLDFSFFLFGSSTGGHLTSGSCNHELLIQVYTARG